MAKAGKHAKKQILSLSGGGNNKGSYIPVNYNIEYRFCMLDEELCGLPLHGLLLRSFRLKRGTRGFAAQTAAFLHA